MQSPRRYWPYDELKTSRDGARIVVTAPWLTIQFDADDRDIDRASLITEKISAGTISAENLDDLNWFLTSLASYPFAYILPRPHTFGSDSHALSSAGLPLDTPAKALSTLGIENSVKLAPEWTWDTEAALEFSKSQSGFDPESLFSIARRFHLLNDIENNKTVELLTFVETIPKNSSEFRESAAFMLRQNHYITEKCEMVLSAALPLAQSADEAIRNFVQAEKGHDKLLKKALLTMGADDQQVPVLDCVKVLMELFHLIAKRNLLAFSMVVDIFERTSYRKEDPFAKALQDGGETQAATLIELHRDINDSGGHENVAVEFLKNMQPVSKEYAIESLRLAELLTQVIHLISADTLVRFKNQI